MGAATEKAARRVCKIFNTQLPYGPEIPLLGSHTEKNHNLKWLMHPIFRTALLIRAETENQSARLETEKWRWVRQLNTGTLLTHKAGLIIPLAAAKVDQVITMCNEVSQREKYQISSTGGIYPMYTNEILYKTEADLQTSKTNLQLPILKKEKEG